MGNHSAGYSQENAQKILASHWMQVRYLGQVDFLTECWRLKTLIDQQSNIKRKTCTAIWCMHNKKYSPNILKMEQ